MYAMLGHSGKRVEGFALLLLLLTAERVLNDSALR